jgi:hypothetical protein
VSGYIGQTEGTLYAEVDYRNLANVSIFTIQTSSISSGAVRIDTVDNSKLRCHILGSNGEAIMDQTISSPLLNTGINKIALGYSSAASGLCIALNGTAVFTGTAASGFTMSANTILLGSRSHGAPQFFNNRLRAAAIYTTRLDNTTLANLTRLN